MCVPSRAALLSGRFNHITEAWNNFKGLDSTKFRNWTEELQVCTKISKKKKLNKIQANGYQTKILGKMDDKSGHHSESERVESWTRGVKFALRQEPRPVAKTVGDGNTREVQENLQI